MSEHLERRLKAFAYHRPSPEVQEEMGHLRQYMQDLARYLDSTIPECREKSLAFTALEECSMWGMKALSLTDPGAVQVSP